MNASEFSCMPLASQAMRLNRCSYPLGSSMRIRWSDTQDGQVSRVAIGHLFEDMRLITLRDLLGARHLGELPWKGMLRAQSLEHLAPATLQRSVIDLCAGIASMGTSSFTYALAAFQSGECVALGEAVEVRVDVAMRPCSFEPEQRHVLQSALMPGIEKSPVVPPARDLSSADNYAWCQDYMLRFSDTDKVGHINNVAMLRYHDNAVMAFLHDALDDLTMAGVQLSVRRQQLSLNAETFYPGPLSMHAALVQVESQSFVLELASYQADRCTSTCTTLVTCADASGQPTALLLPLLAKLKFSRSRIAG